MRSLIWLVGWLVFSGLMAFLDSISVNIEPSSGEREGGGGEKKRNDRREKNIQRTPTHTNCKAHALQLSKLVERPGTERYPAQSHYRTMPGELLVSC